MIKKRIGCGVWIIGAIFVLFISPVYAIASTKCWSNTRITSLSSDEAWPDIYEDKIVWHDYRSGTNWDVYLYDLSTSEERSITTNSVEQPDPVIWGHRVVYEDQRLGVGGWTIWMYDLTTGVESQVSSSEWSKKLPEIYEDKVVWRDTRPETNGKWNIYLKDLTTGIEKRISSIGQTDPALGFWRPSIWENRIVWQDDRNGNWDIYMYDLSNNTEVQLTNNPYDQTYSFIYQDLVVYQDNRNGNYDIYMLNLTTNTEAQITTDGNDQIAPDIYGDRIVWQDVRNGNWDIYVHDLSDNSEVAVTTEGNNQEKPIIYGDRIAWHDRRSGNWDIYIAEPLPSAPSNFSATGGNGQVILDWADNPENNISGYNIYRSTVSDSGYVKLNDTLILQSQYQDNGVLNNAIYYYRVAAIDSSQNEGCYSQETSVTPHDNSAPQPSTGLIASAGNQVVNLNWNDNTESDLSGYNVYRSTTSGGTYSKVNSSLLTSSQYSDSGLTNGTTYYYKVTAVDTASSESGYSSEVNAKPMSNPPTASASATPTNGTAPLTVSFTGTGTDDGSITKYEWDFDGNGTYDWSSTTGGSTVKTYSSAGTWTANLRVTDNDNLTATALVTITVSSPPIEKESPTASISASSTSGTAPLTVTFTYSGTDTDGTIKQYEMDFDGNGTYDFVSTSSGSVSYTYGQAGSYTATLKVTDNDGLSGTATVSITVNNPTGTNPLVADANCSPSSVTVGETVTLTGSAIGGSGSYIAYIWDYEGDGEYDWASTTTGTITHIYDTAGSYSPTVMVVDSGGLTDTDSASLTVNSPSTLKVWISQPKNGDSIWGTDVTLHANTAPGNITKSVKFQYKGATTDWTDIGNEMIPPPNSFFSTTWNVTGLTEGDYQLRAVGKDTSDNTVNSETITVTVTQINPDVNDGVDNSGNREKKQKIDKDETTESSMEDYTSVEIPYGTLDADTTLTITAFQSNPQDTTEGANSSLDKFRGIELESNPTLEKSVTVTIPYSDTDNDGIVDGTNIPEKDLKLWWYNTTTNKWEKISDTEVDTTNNRAKAKMGHLSDFAVGSEDTASPSAPSGLSATAGDGQVSLTWTNPTDTDFAGVKVIRKAGGYPASVTDGTEVYSGTGSSKTDTGLTNETACYYSVFAYDEVPNYSSGAQATATPQAPSTGGDGGGGGCFIATAAYGTPMASEVKSLCQFRDAHLLTNPAGKRLISFYYKMSPPIADFIAKHASLRSMVRFFLKPVVKLVE